MNYTKSTSSKDFPLVELVGEKLEVPCYIISSLSLVLPVPAAGSVAKDLCNIEVFCLSLGIAIPNGAAFNNCYGQLHDDRQRAPRVCHWSAEGELLGVGGQMIACTSRYWVYTKQILATNLVGFKHSSISLLSFLHVNVPCLLCDVCACYFLD